MAVHAWHMSTYRVTSPVDEGQLLSYIEGVTEVWLWPGDAEQSAACSGIHGEGWGRATIADLQGRHQTVSRGYAWHKLLQVSAGVETLRLGVYGSDHYIASCVSGSFGEVEVDALTNDDFSGFDQEVPLRVLRRLQSEASDLFEDMRAERTRAHGAAGTLGGSVLARTEHAVVLAVRRAPLADG
eukprot:3242261-Amphidinium_carterae.1